MNNNRLLAIAGLASAVLLAFASPALANGHGRFAAAAGPHALTARIDHHFLGIVPSARAGGRLHGRPTKGEFAGTRFSSGNNLLYWGGPVMATNKTYAIYWLGTGGNGGFSSQYESLINGFFGNVGSPAEQNATNDVYAVDTQYYGPTGAHIANQSSFATSVQDTTNAIPNHCSAEYARSGVVVSGGCVTDTDIQAEVAREIQAQGWTPGPGAMFFVFTPQNVGSCFDSTSGECAYTYYCAYHSNFSDSGQDGIYANMPYSLNSGAPGACDSGEYPNGDQAADDTINLVSHEHNEAITDPDGNAWYDSSGNEIGDKCAWNFGNVLGSTSYGQYNQVINGHDYYVQQEWSNASSGCKLSYGGSSSSVPSITSFSPSSGPRGTQVTINGSGFTGATRVTFGGVSASFTVVSANQIKATVPRKARSGLISVTTSGGTAQSSASFTVT